METGSVDANDGALHAPWGWTQFFSELSDFLVALERQYGLANQAFVEYAVNRLTVSLRNVSRICFVVNDTDEGTSDLSYCISDLHRLNNILSSLLSRWQTYEESTESISYSVPQEIPSRRGRPKFLIYRDQLEYLRSLSFSWTEIASLLGVSRMTVYRRREECGLADEQRDRSISDAELDSMILDLRRDLPYSGQTMILGRLRVHLPNNQARTLECN